MLTRPVSCGVTATIEAMRSVDLVPRFSPFDVLYDEQLDRPVVPQMTVDRCQSHDVISPICET